MDRHVVETRSMTTSSTRKGRSADSSSFKIVNPFGKEHGAPSDSTRHVGDLGNIKTDAQGNAKGSIEDSLIKLFGESSVLGVRAVFQPCLFCSTSIMSPVLLFVLRIATSAFV